jgi:putative tryptophan/tyrosine transport system substrate-binding protein
MKRRAFTAGVGSTLVMPRAARAQRAKLLIGYLSGASPKPVASLTAIFQQRLKEAGFIEGQNIEIDYRWAEGRFDRLPVMADEFVRRGVNVIVAVGGDQSVLAAKAATSNIPIVFTLGADPVRLGLVASLNRPGGNMTGVTQFTSSLEQKRFELLREAVPNAGVMSMLVNPNRPDAERQIREVQMAAQAVGQRLTVARATNEHQIEATFTRFSEERVGALLVASDAIFYQLRENLVALATRHSIPAIYQWRDFVELGGLMSYGTSLAYAYEQVAAYTVRVLKGERPSDLPVQQAVKVELVLNQKAARLLGVVFPLSLLGRADEVIE